MDKSDLLNQKKEIRSQEGRIGTIKHQLDVEQEKLVTMKLELFKNCEMLNHEWGSGYKEYSTNEPIPESERMVWHLKGYDMPFTRTIKMWTRKCGICDKEETTDKEPQEVALKRKTEEIEKKKEQLKKEEEELNKMNSK